MSGYEFTFFSTSQIFAGFLALIVALFLFRYRESPGAKHLALMEVGIAIWGITQGIEVAATSVERTFFWSKLSYFGITSTPLYFLLFAQSYSQHKDFSKSKWFYAFLVIPVLTILIVFTNQYHHLHWQSIELKEGENLGHYTYGAWFWIFYVYTYLLMIWAFATIYWAVFKFPGHYKPQVISLLFGAGLPMITNLIYVFNINPIQGYDWTPISFCLSGLFIAFGVLRLRLFKLIPFARNIMVDNMEEGVLVVDSTRTIVDSNEAIIHLFGKDSYIGKPFVEKFPEFFVLLDDEFTDKIHHKEVEVVRNGHSRYFDLTISEFKQKRRFFAGYLLILHEETDRVNAERALRKVNDDLTNQIKIKEGLISDLDAYSHMVAHDLKNMLGVIVSSSEAIAYSQKNNSGADVAAYNELIGISAKKTFNITRELLLLASIRKEDVKVSELNMQDLLDEVLPRLQPMIEETGAKFDYPESWPLVMGHSQWIEEVWYNYLSNAMKYGGSPPVVKLGYQKESTNKIRFTVADNGTGLPQEELDKLFKQFTRLNGLKVKGHGLGLSIVKRILEKLGGEVGVTSENKPGKGCVFSFVLKIPEPKE